VRAQRHSGNALSGPLPTLPDLAQDHVGVRVRGLWVERMPVGLEPLEGAARLVLARDAEEALRFHARSTRELLHARGERARALLAQVEAGTYRRSAQAFDECAALPPGASLRTDARVSEAATVRGHLGVEVGRASAEREVQLAVSLGEPGTPEREQLVLAEPLTLEAGLFVLCVPGAGGSAGPAALLVAVHAGAESDADTLRATSEALQRSADETLTRRTPLGEAEAWRREAGRALQDLDTPERRRAALLYLARRGGAPLAFDAALVAAEADLTELARFTRDELLRAGEQADRGWIVERCAWTWLARQATEERLAPELNSLLLRHGGEAARLPSAVGDLARRATDAADLAQRLAFENRILLEHSSPSSRLRAYDWLAARGLAPEGFDPRAPAAERRAVLERIAERERAEAGQVPR
jgi:hypothetical protein